MITLGRYSWLERQGQLPKMVELGIQLLGIKEIPGRDSNPIILGFAKELGVSKIYTNDDMAWCALVQSYLCKLAGKPLPGKGYDLIRAASFLKWGEKVEVEDIRLGDIVIFKRDGGYHVAMYIAESADTYFVMGGNQSNSFSITEIAKTRLEDARRFYSVAPPASAKKYTFASNGQISSNEA